MTQCRVLAAIVGCFGLACLVDAVEPPAAAAPATSWNEPESYRGLAWGAPLSAAKTLLKDAYAADDWRRAQCYCSWPEPKGGGFCKAETDKDPAKMPLERACLTTFDAGSVRLQDEFRFDHDRFVAAFMNFHPDEYATLRAMFVEKYGQPTSIKTSVFQTKMGVKVDNEELEWAGQRVSVGMQRFHGRLDKARAYLLVNEWAKKVEAQQAEQQRRGKNAF